MGWLFSHKSRDESAIDYLKRTALTWNVPADQHPQIVDATAGVDHVVFAVRFPASYIKARGALFPQYVPDRVDGSVTGALIFLVRHAPKARDGYNFGYKDIAETGGPAFYACSPRILETLSPLNLTAGQSAQWAQEWRDNVRTYAAQPKLARIKPGALVRLAQALHFSDGAQLQEFRAFKRGAFTGKRGAKRWNPNAGATLFRANGGVYRLTNSQLAGAQVEEV